VNKVIEEEPILIEEGSIQSVFTVERRNAHGRGLYSEHLSSDIARRHFFQDKGEKRHSNDDNDRLTKSSKAVRDHSGWPDGAIELTKSKITEFRTPPIA
jgi:hypothetical protein